MSELASSLSGWAPVPVEWSDRVSSWSVEAFAALLDQPSPLDGAATGVLPPMWHWFGFLAHPAQRELGADGHPAAGRFLPPIPNRRRMFAGARWRQHQPLPVDEPITCRSSVTSVDVKTGRSGEMAFVTVRNEFSRHGELAVLEEQDIVYRSQPDPPAAAAEPTGAPARVTPAEPTEQQSTEQQSTEQQSTEELPAAEHELRLSPDAALLFRFSALTYNAHRIHYDQPYATAIEGYPGLVVHGPLLALLALELPRRNRPEAPVAEFRYRLRRPAFAGIELRSWSEPAGSDGWLELATGPVGGPASLTGTARLAGEA
ncbi:MAG TPA: MaoC family dehydratase N-terminal domain-containing protein [Pseudonocardia sp.]|nr:MaoC family dehydratase N-terminal domain-containing protein [Pseudonocardia sp.]